MNKLTDKSPGNYSRVFIFFASLLLFDIYGLIVTYNLLIEYLYNIPRFLYGSIFEYNFIVTIFGDFNYLYYKLLLFINLLLGNVVGFTIIRFLNKRKVILPCIRNENQPDTFYAQVILSNLLVNFTGAIILVLLSVKLVGPIYLAIFFSCGYLSALALFFIMQLRHHPEILMYRVKW